MKEEFEIPPLVSLTERSRVVKQLAEVV